MHHQGMLRRRCSVCRWEEEEVNRRLDRQITDAFAAINKERTQRRITYRKAAYTVAVQEVMRAHLNRGFD